jgi:hypothetical protein
VIVFEVFRDPILLVIDDEYAYKVFVKIPTPRELPCSYGMDAGSAADAIGHYFHFGAGSVDCWYFRKTGTIAVRELSDTTIAGDIDVTFLPGTECCNEDRVDSFRISGPFSLPKVGPKRPPSLR